VVAGAGVLPAVAVLLGAACGTMVLVSSTGWLVG
jgi:hypothetical protein